MSKIILLLLAVFLFGIVSSVEYPDEVEVGEEFKISFDTNDKEVKIDFTIEETRVSKIYDEKWKSTFYYIKASEDGEYILKLEKSGIAVGVIKTRNSNGKTTTVDEIEIKVLEPKIVKSEEVEVKKEEVEVVSGVSISQNVTQSEVIKLEPKGIKKAEISEVKDTHNLAVYGFVGFCLILGVLYGAKFYRYKRKSGIV